MRNDSVVMILKKYKLTYYLASEKIFLNVDKNAYQREIQKRF